MPALVKLLPILVVAGAVFAAAGPGQEPVPTDTALRDCATRVEGGVIRPRRPRDTVIGPIAWYRLPGNFDPDQQDRGRKYGYEVTGMKALAIVRAGHTVTVVVPRRQREWMWLDYARDGSDEDPGTHRVEFRPCPRRSTAEGQREACQWEPFRACSSGLTQFNGVIAVDYDNAPREGRCARLIVRAGGETKTRRALVFRRLCARARASSR